MPGKVDQTALQLLLDGEVTAIVDAISVHVLGGGQFFCLGLFVWDLIIRC